MACGSKKTCFKCRKRHHTLIHFENEANHMVKPSTSKIELSEGNPDIPTKSFFSSNFKRALLSTALVHVQGADGRGQILRALLDSGSEISFITNSACKKLKLQRKATSMKITGLGNTQTALSSAKVTFRLESLNSTFQTQTTALVIEKITDIIPSQQLDLTKFTYIQGIKLADPKFHSPGPIDLLLGADIYAQIIGNGLIRGDKDTPTAQNTQLGWILMGTFNEDSTKSVETFSVRVDESQKIDEQLRKFGEQKEIQLKAEHHEDNDVILIDDVPSLKLPNRDLRRELRQITSTQRHQSYKRPFEVEPASNKVKKILKGPWTRIPTKPHPVPTSVKGETKPDRTGDTKARSHMTVSTNIPASTRLKKDKSSCLKTAAVPLKKPTMKQITPVQGSPRRQSAQPQKEKVPHIQHFIVLPALWKQVSKQPIPWDEVFAAKKSFRIPTEDGDFLRFTKVPASGKIKIRLQVKSRSTMCVKFGGGGRMFCPLQNFPEAKIFEYSTQHWSP